MSIENVIGVIVGFLVFLYMFLVKVPIKALHRRIVKRRYFDDEKKASIAFRVANVSLILWVTVLAVVLNYAICSVLNIHHKLCCSFKAVAIAVSLYSIYEQIWGDTKKEPEV